jgi:hypothetical protein
MSDLDRELRDLLTAEHLQLPARPDAVRIVHDGVRRRRRHRTIAVSAATVAAVGATVAAALVVPAALTADGHNRTTPVQPDQRYDVAWVDSPAPTLWSPKAVQPQLPSMNAPRCLASQLHVGNVLRNGAAGRQFYVIRLRNVSDRPCQLVGTPQRVAAKSTGRPDVVATRGLNLGSGGVGGDLQSGKLGYLTVETDSACTQPTDNYSSLSVTLPSGTSLSIPMQIDVKCGLKTGGLGVSQPQPRIPVDPRTYLVPSIDASARVTAGRDLTYVVSLTNPTGSAISLAHCPGYVQTLGPNKADLGLNCSGVRSIGAGESVRYEMHLAVSADTPRGPTRLTWVLLLMGKPSLSSATVLVE